jgi:drug/metabolite transporter (DMT)-like permease
LAQEREWGFVKPSQLENQSSKGLSLAFIGGLALSFDIPLIRLAMSDPYTVMAARGLGIAFILFIYWRFFANKSAMPKSLLADKDFIIVGALSGANNICFTMAVFNTSTANVVFILAFNAMLAALLSWPMVGERLKLHTWLAILATLVGVGIIVVDGLGTGNLFGDVLALMCAGLLALSLTLTRKSGKDLSLAPGFGGLVSAAFAMPTILLVDYELQAPIWLALDALILVPIAGITLWLAPRFITAPQVALFYLLETVLAPLWVWIVFFEVPSTNVFVGGFVVTAAIGLHALYELKTHQKKPLQEFQMSPHSPHQNAPLQT